MTRIDAALQAQVDAQLMEQGAFAPLELLISSGRLTYSDYESWRRREIDLLDEVLMGNRDRILAQIAAAVGYARDIGLVEQVQEFHAWRTQPSGETDKLLRISADTTLQRLIASRYAPAQSAPQLDLFFDNPVVALTNGIVRALWVRNAPEAQRQLDKLYAQAPNHADLAAFDQLLGALQRLDRSVDDPQQTLDFLQKVTPTAKRLLGAQARDLLTPLWRQLADALRDHAFAPHQPELHRSHALSQAQDWAGVGECVLGESQWWRHAPLCLRLAQSAFYRQHRIEALSAWCHLCWRNPPRAAQALDARTQPDAGVTALWQRFLGSEEDVELTPADFPAWLLLHEPGLVQHLAEDLPAADTPQEQQYRCVHRWIHARRAGRQEEEMSLRKTLQAHHPAAFQLLKRITSAS